MRTPGRNVCCSRSCSRRWMASSNAPHRVTSCPLAVSRIEQTVAIAPSPTIVTHSPIKVPSRLEFSRTRPNVPATTPRENAPGRARQHGWLTRAPRHAERSARRAAVVRGATAPSRAPAVRTLRLSASHRQRGLIRRNRCRGVGAARVCAKLLPHQARIEPAARHEFLMSAGLRDAALAQHQDAVGVSHRGQAMGDDEAGAVVHQALQRLLHQRLRFAIERAGGLVQDQDSRVLQQRPRDGDALPLPAGEVDSALAQQRFIAIWQGEDELVCIGRLRRRDDFVVAGIGPAVRDVLADAA